MTRHPLLDAGSVGPLREHLSGIGRLVAVFERQDSGCPSYGVALGAERWFVKTATDERSRAALDRAVAFHAAVTHPAIVPLRGTFTAAGQPVLVYSWVEGEPLYHPTLDPGLPRHDPRSVWSRFRGLPVAEIEAVIEPVLDAHVVVEEAGFVASDFYDGCLLYDFGRRRVRLIDFDEYRPGPFVATEPPSGSRRFMAPEEVLGGTFDTRTTVFTLGRAIRLLLDAGEDERSWRGNSAQLAVVARATDPEPDRRFPSVAALRAALR